MSNINTRINELAVAIAQEINKTRSTIGKLTDLQTTSKVNVVSAINELSGSLGTLTNTVNNINNTVNQATSQLINDSSVSTTTTYSSDKITKVLAEQITLAKQAVKDELINGAPGTYDTLKEIADYIAQDKDALAAITNALNNKLSVDSFTTLNQEQKNIILNALGYVDTDFVAVFRAALQS